MKRELTFWIGLVVVASLIAYAYQHKEPPSPFADFKKPARHSQRGCAMEAIGEFSNDYIDIFPKLENDWIRAELCTSSGKGHNTKCSRFYCSRGNRGITTDERGDDEFYIDDMGFYRNKKL